jgi:hypothetical protein
MKKKFEYKILDVVYNTWSGKPEIDLQEVLNQLGAQGWELVSAPHSHGTVASFILKREIV